MRRSDELLLSEPDRRSLRNAADRFARLDQFTGEYVIPERAVYAAWVNKVNRNLIWETYLSTMTWAGYQPQLVQQLGEPTILLHSDEIYSSRRADQSRVYARQKLQRKTEAAEKAAELEAAAADAVTFYVPNLVKNYRDNITLFRQA